jgi:hypothetical protein
MLSAKSLPKGYRKLSKSFIKLFSLEFYCFFAIAVASYCITKPINGPKSKVGMFEAFSSSYDFQLSN